VKRILVVGDGELVNRLPEVLFRPGVETDVASFRSSVLAKSMFVHEFFPYLVSSQDSTWDEDNQALLEFLAESSYDLYVFSSDSLVRRVRDSPLDIDTKARVLPVRNRELMPILDSKSNLAIQCMKLGIPFPTSRVFRSAEELQHASDGLSELRVIKGDRGHGGTAVVIMKPNELLPWGRIHKLHWPVIVQENLEMPLVSVEALFLSGKLNAWLYSIPLKGKGKTGPSTKRLYQEPPFLDFVDSLEKISGAGNLNGFFNTSWFLDTENKKHILFELDARPNVWHKYGPKLGVDWCISILSINSEPVEHNSQVGDSRVIYAYPRHLIYGLQSLNVIDVITWLIRSRGTWDAAPLKDHAVNRWDSEQILRFWSIWYQAFVFQGWKLLPFFLKRFLTRTQTKQRIATLLGF
jgi:hypothetical protein